MAYDQSDALLGHDDVITDGHLVQQPEALQPDHLCSGVRIHRGGIAGADRAHGSLSELDREAGPPFRCRSHPLPRFQCDLYSARVCIALKTKPLVAEHLSQTPTIGGSRGCLVGSLDEPHESSVGAAVRAELQLDRQPVPGRAPGNPSELTHTQQPRRLVAHLWHTRVRNAVQPSQPASTNHAGNGRSRAFLAGLSRTHNPSAQGSSPCWPTWCFPCSEA